MESILEVLMRRDGLSKIDAEERINEVKMSIREGVDPEELVFSELGLEPDYIPELL